MSKKKADWLAEARKAGVTGLTTKSTVAEIRAALGDEPAKPTSKSKGTARSKPTAKSKGQKAEDRAAKDEAEMITSQEKLSAARRAERAEAETNRRENEVAAKALIRTGPQQAVDRAAEKAGK